MSWPGNGTANGSAGPKVRAPSMPAPAPEKTLRVPLDSREKPEIDASKISAYARLDFDNYTFFVQTLQVVLGRKSNNELLSAASHSVDVHLSSGKAISRRHAKIFYNFGTQRFEISVLGRNGAFVHNQFVAKGLTVPLTDSSKIQIGEIPFTFVLPSIEPTEDKKNGVPQLFNPSDALNLRTNLYTSPRKTPEPSGTATPEKVPDAAKEPESRKSGAGLKADLVRRLSIARRKSLSSASADELNALISELEADPLNDIGELDEEVRLLLNNSRHMSKEDIDKEEDEIDRLVQQHNMQDSSALGPDLDVNVLDQEIASLAPLLDSAKPARLPHEDKTRPRMGKAATIQPPANRIYGRVPPPPPYAGYSAPYANTAQNYGYPAYSQYYQPPPLLQVAVPAIKVGPAPRAVAPFRAISVGSEYEPAPVCVLKTLAPANTPKYPLRKREQPFRKSKVQNLKDIPEQFKTKPATSISAMVSAVLKEKPLTLSDISEAIRELFPYYKYCPDGWQSSVSHSVRYNKMFCAVQKPELEANWQWAVDDKYLEEKEKTRKRQHEVAMARAKEAALRSSEFRQRNMYSGQFGQASASGYGPNHRYPASGYGSPKPKSIAEIASEIKRDPYSKTPLYFQRPERREEESIKAQLAANRAKPHPADNSLGTADSSVRPAASEPSAPVMNTDTKKSLTYLQKELFTLYKARRLSYNTAVTTEIITKALATTIAQVNIIGAKAGCGDNALTFLVEKAPSQVSKILDIALTKSIKEREAQNTPEHREKSEVSESDEPRASSGANSPRAGAGLSKPSFSGGLSRPAFAGLGKPQGFNKPGALAKPPQFLSNKPRLGENPGEKRAAEEDSGARKVIKIDEDS